jgi:hypothetical protein
MPIIIPAKDTSSKTATPVVSKTTRARTLQMEDLIDKMLHSSLKLADNLDIVVITITHFHNVLEHDLVVDGRRQSRLCKHLVSLNGKKAVPAGNKALDAQFKKSTPKTIKMTVIDGEIPPNKPKHKYYPIGIAFKTGPHHKGKQRNAVHKKDFKNGKVYLFGETMYLTINRKFNFRHLSEYALIVQRDDTQIGVIDPPVINYM